MVGQVLRLGEKPYMSPGMWRPDGRCPMPDVAFLLNEGRGEATRDWRGRTVGILAGASGVPVWMSGLYGPMLVGDTSANSKCLTAASSSAWSTTGPITVSVLARLDTLPYGASGNTRFCTLISKGYGGVTEIPFALDYRFISPKYYLTWLCYVSATNYGLSTTSYAWTVGAWHRITATFDGTLWSLYVDGAFFASTSAAVTRPSTTVRGAIGAMDLNGTLGRGWMGAFADAEMWSSVALTPAQVAAHYADPYMWLRSQSPARFYSLPNATRIAAMADYYRRLRAA